MFNEFRRAFFNGIIHASTKWRKIYRSATVGFLWLLAVGCCVVGALAIATAQDPIQFAQGVVLILNAASFSLFGTTAVYMFSTSEYDLKLELYRSNFTER